MKNIIFRIVVAALVLLLAGSLVLRLVHSHSPTVDIFGSYFPAWMICIIGGTTLTLVAHWVVQLWRLQRYLGPAPLIYPCLMIIFTFTTWLFFYQN
jgi:hypothetical protein